MKILFAGPSLYGRIADRRIDGDPTIECRGPAQQGDLARAVADGASVIGLVDGRYEDVAAVWHKEILFALAEGVHVAGAGSMGALRAAECADFGMVGIGAVFERYRSDELSDDAAVAQLHGPAELGYLPLTEPLVNVEATLSHLGSRRLLPAGAVAALRRSAAAIFFKERTWPVIAAGAGFHDDEAERLLELVDRHSVDVKRTDAALLVDHIRRLEPRRGRPDPSWTFARTRLWQETEQSVAARGLLQSA
jgi:hypothetical protein